MGFGCASKLRRILHLGLVATVVVTATWISLGEADAAIKRKKGRATLTVVGAITKQESCQGDFLVSVKFVRKTADGDQTRFTAVQLDKDGLWTAKLSRAKRTTYTISANLIGHPDKDMMPYDSQSFKVNSSKKNEVDLGKIRIPACDD